MMAGWFVIHHDMMDTVIGSDDRLLGLLARLSHKANAVEGWHDGQLIERGQLVLTDRNMQTRLYPRSSNPPCIKTIRKGLNQLNEAGAISIDFLSGDGARLVTVNHYGPESQLDAVKSAAPNAAPNAAPSAAPSAAHIRSKEGKENKNSSANDAAFETWWTHYPRKVSKKPTRKAFSAAMLSLREVHSENALEWLINRTDAYAKSVSDSPADKIKYPQGWLNDERYNDDLDRDSSSSTAPSLDYAAEASQRRAQIEQRRKELVS